MISTINKTVLLILCLVFFNYSWSQEYHFATAQSGLILRESPTTTSDRIGKLPYGQLVKILEETDVDYQVTEGDTLITSLWVKVVYSNFPYLDAYDRDGYEWKKTGYVVKHYLEKLEKEYINITTEEIEASEFKRLYKEPTDKLVKLTNFEEVKKLLSGRVQWTNSEMMEDGGAIDNITLLNGQKLNIDENFVDFGFVAYYPSEEIILFEGGHSSDFSISIKTGETIETIGNPDYIVHSPSGKYRINGWFPGQECSVYFFQEKIGDRYTYLSGFGFGDDKFGTDLCYYTKFSWINDEQFIYALPDYSNGIEERKYFIGKINK